MNRITFLLSAALLLPACDNSAGVDSPTTDSATETSGAKATTSRPSAEDEGEGGEAAPATSRPTPPADDKAGITPQKIGSIPNCSSFDGIFLAGQPSQSDIGLLEQHGITAVINMRTAPEMAQQFDEKSAVEEAGMDYIQVPLGKPEQFDDAAFDRYRDLFNNTERPFMLHCGSANRVGAVWLAWRVVDGNLTLDEAAAEARAVGLRSPALQQQAEAYIARKQK